MISIINLSTLDTIVPWKNPSRFKLVFFSRKKVDMILIIYVNLRRLFNRYLLRVVVQNVSEFVTGVNYHKVQYKGRQSKRVTPTYRCVKVCCCATVVVCFVDRTVRYGVLDIVIFCK